MKPLRFDRVLLRLQALAALAGITDDSWLDMSAGDILQRIRDRAVN